ncbi:MAG: hypothetical protein FJ144_23750 [Deltaproteobacteria bacterium]|nr:hypothetical protein [Deltaproteobacteria bacterium]
MTPRSGFLGALLIGGMLVVSMPESVSGGGGPRPSERVEHLDGTGVSIFTILPDQSEWTIENFWPNNSVNGTVGFPDDTTTFINCAPTNRTIEETALECRLYDATTSTWGDLISTTVAREYLDGDFQNQ